jgi:predicted DNA-binding protein (MmcQ/YjbR family)
MDIEKYRNYCLSKKQVTESFPFPSLPNVLVFKVADKMFTATDVSTFGSFSIKHDPEIIDELRSKFDAVVSHTYFSNKYWSNLLINKSIPEKILFELLDTSYNLTVKKLTKKMRSEMGL